jgi:hypothetical protein
MSESEPACVHILVPIIARAPLGRQWLSIIDGWLTRFGAGAIVTPVIASGLSHQKVFKHAPQGISRLQIAPWGGNPNRLASLVLQRALHNERPSLFISYRRQEAAAVADQIFDEMSHRGFRVFLDRFSGTSGRLFPQELAEEMADRDVVLVLETPQLSQSRWTLWEIAFARLYRIGLLALRWPNAPQIPGINDRRPISLTSSQTLGKADLRDVGDFIEQRHTLAALTRRAFYEALVEAAARSKKGTVQATGPGVLDILNRKQLSVGTVLPAGRPGRLGDVRKLIGAAPGSTKAPLILAGQHGHLPLSAQDDLKWLASSNRVTLSGRTDIYQQVRALL